jgi:hypothetical protein
LFRGSASANLGRQIYSARSADTGSIFNLPPPKSTKVGNDARSCNRKSEKTVAMGGREPEAAFSPHKNKQGRGNGPRPCLFPLLLKA